MRLRPRWSSVIILAAVGVIAGPPLLLAVHLGLREYRLDHGPDLEAVREQLTADIEGAARVLEPVQLEFYGSPYSSAPCSLPYIGDGWFPFSEKGRTYLFHNRKFAGPVDDPGAAADLVAEYWRGKGYEVRVWKGRSPVFRTFIASVGVEVSDETSLRFRASARGMNLHASAPCVRGSI